MISISDVKALKPGQTLYHATIRNADGTPARARVNGKPLLLKTQLNFFKLPMKYGLKTCFYIGPSNAADWQLTEPARVPPRKAVKRSYQPNYANGEG